MLVTFQKSVEQRRISISKRDSHKEEDYSARVMSELSDPEEEIADNFLEHVKLLPEKVLTDGL